MFAAGSREATPYDAPSNKQNPAFNPARLKKNGVSERCFLKKKPHTKTRWKCLQRDLGRQTLTMPREANKIQPLTPPG